MSIEHLTGSDFNDTLFFDGLENGQTLNGGNGNDVLWANHNEGGILNGGAGNDTLHAGNGNATLNGGTGNDHLTGGDSGVLNGGDGDDLLEAGIELPSILNGGAGADTLRGSGGSNSGDIYDYNAVSDSPAGAGRDAIVGFHGEGTLQGDQIDLRDIYPGTLIWGGLWTTGHVRYVGGVVQVNTDSDTAAEFEIQLIGAPALVVGGAGTDIFL